MAVNPSRTKMTIDVAAGVLLRSPGAAALSASAATTTETGISLSALRTAYWHNQEIPHGVFRVGVDVLLFGGTTPTLILNLLVSDVLAMTSPVTIASYTILGVGYVEFDVDSKSIPQLSATLTTKFMAIQAITTGSALTMKYGAWLGKCTDA